MTENIVVEEKIYIEDDFILKELFGEYDKNKKLIEEELNISLSIKDDEIKIIGDGGLAELGKILIEDLIKRIGLGEEIDRQIIRFRTDILVKDKSIELGNLLDDIITVTSTGRRIKPKTLGQKRYIDSIRKNEVVFGIGPAGTGKTYLAMSMAIQALKNKEVNKIILTRPAVEAGENLGFLPGDLQEKVDPYLRPIYDALFDVLGTQSYMRYMEKGLIEVAPLAYMRGRTLDNAYVILDEAQNTTNEQMKMFLTRLGFGSKAIITGDITQVDLPKGKKSGLRTVSEILKDVKGLDFIYLGKEDIVRHPLVQRIIEAYDNYDKLNE